MTIEGGETLEKELAGVKTLLSRNRAELRILHKENSKIFSIAVIILFLAFFEYGIYVMLTNT